MGREISGTATARFVEPMRVSLQSEADRSRVLGYRAVQVRDFVERYLASNGIPPNYYEICAELGMQIGNLSVTIGRLEKRGIFRREGSGRQRRINLA